MYPETRSTKVCRICQAEKPETRDNFYWRSDSNSFRSECKSCVQESRLISKYQLDFNKYRTMLKAQKHRCGICQCTLESSRYNKFAVDHCHKTGTIRGLLCTNCNTALGLLKDSPKRLESALRYLRNTTLRKDIV